MNEELVLTEERGHVLLITLNRPNDMNAFNTPLAQALASTLDAFDANPNVRVAVLTGGDEDLVQEWILSSLSTAA